MSPARIGRYAVLRPLGEGGMGVVYAAYDEELDRKVAVKLLRSVAPPGAERRARLIREAQALARVSHPNVVSVYEVGEADGQVFIAMEFIDGATLTAWQASGPSWDEVLQMYRAAGEGLDAAHRAGLVHRDFKPDNVLVGKDGRARVADFGLARGLRSEESLPAALPGTPDRPALVSLTLQGAILGTPAYMSPEQHRGETADSRSDQWSFCAALYAALYGMAPFAGDTLAALSANVQAGRLRPAPAGSTVPARINAALRRGLAAAPEERYAAMAELLSALVVDPQRDPALAPMTRRSFIIPMVLGMGAMTVLMYLLRAQRWLTPARIVGSAGTLLLGVSGMAFGLRRSLRENAFHLGLVKLMILLLAQLFMVRGVGCLLGQGITHILAMEQVVLAGSFAVIALHFLPGCWAMAAASAAMALALVRWPETMMSLLACYYLLLTLALAGLWSHAAGGHPAIRDRAPALGARRAKDAS
ncbi:MAG TPA: serine/threonine-protein kinase [Pseudomonadota bacterium]|nr:serine/threonine-protein kinase [Pseudomonadota bacterium]